MQTIKESQPSIQSNQVLVKVKVVSLNPLDWKIRKGEMKLMSGSKFPRHPAFFFYKNEYFTSKVLATLLFKRLKGEWLFTDLGNLPTQIEWTYRAIPKNFISNLLVRLLQVRAVRSLLNDALNIIKNDLETG